MEINEYYYQLMCDLIRLTDRSTLKAIRTEDEHIYDLKIMQDLPDIIDEGDFVLSFTIYRTRYKKEYSTRFEFDFPKGMLRLETRDPDKTWLAGVGIELIRLLKRDVSAVKDLSTIIDEDIDKIELKMKEENDKKDSPI